MGTVFYSSSPSWCPKTREVKAANQVVRKPWVLVQCLINDRGSRGLLLHQPAQKHVLEGPSLITSQPWAAGSQMLPLTASALTRSKEMKPQPFITCQKSRLHVSWTSQPDTQRQPPVCGQEGLEAKLRSLHPSYKGEDRNVEFVITSVFHLNRKVESMGIDLYRKLKDLTEDLHSTLTCVFGKPSRTP